VAAALRQVVDLEVVEEQNRVVGVERESLPELALADGRLVAQIVERERPGREPDP